MYITVDSICKEFDIRPEEIFAFMDEENIELGGSLMHDISIDLHDFRKFIEYMRRQLKTEIEKSQKDLAELDSRAEAFVRSSRGSQLG